VFRFFPDTLYIFEKEEMGVYLKEKIYVEESHAEVKNVK